MNDLGARRYRVTGMQFDTRATILGIPVRDEWDPEVQTRWRETNEGIIESIKNEYGGLDLDRKLRDFREVGPLPFSIIAFHNVFLRQVRDAFVIGSYYPSLVGACALGERILNNLMLALRDSFRSEPEYKLVYRKQSFGDWQKIIRTLTRWGVLRPKTNQSLRALARKRQESIHFRPEIEPDARPTALEAITLLRELIEEQFGAFGTQPWFIENTPGESWIKKDYEQDPFVRAIYLPSATLLGYRHEVESISRKGWVVKDDFDYGRENISDEEFARRRREQGA